MDATFAMFAVLAFLAVVLGLEGAYNFWASKHSAEQKRLRDRLAAMRGEIRTEVSLERVQEERAMSGLQKWLSGSGWGSGLVRWVGTSGLAVSAAEVLLYSLIAATVGFVLPQVLGKPMIFGMIGALALGVLPWWWVGRARKKRVERFEIQFPDALDLMGRALRAGHSFPTAIKMVGDEIADPMGKDFRILSDEMNYGVPPAEALNRLAQRVPLDDVQYFVVAVLIQRETGGNLAELLDNIAGIVRARLKLMGEVRTLSAEGKLSAYILTALPFCVAAVVNIVNPEFMKVLWTDPAGLKMVGVALFMMLVGILWMRKIIQIRV